ncbi:RHS repeat-associated core domain-containing protein [Paracidovorax cattleyae]|uniref:RHS repeat-associated core domain-containing protein n=1 Tax=Paracidovorax cattleyae TaxID=80868 RepID=UPI00336A6D0D
MHTEGPQGLQHTLYEPDTFVPLLRLERDRAIPTPVQAMFALEDHGGASHAAALFAGLPRAQREWLEQALNDALGPHGDALRARLQAGLPEETGALLSAGLRSVRQQRQAATQAHAKRIRHVLCDHLGTPIALVDANGPQAGLVTWAATFHAWGALREEYDPHGIGQDIRFQGQQFDAETGLHYNRFRYYDPMLGQYVTQDPIGLAGGVNKLIYPTNPTSSKDPLGLKEEGGWLSKIFGWGEKASSIKDAAEAGQLVLENRKLEKEFGRLEDDLMSCISQTPTCSTEKMQATEKRMEEIKKKILKNTGEITRIMMETPGTSAGGPVHIPGMKP